MLALVIPARSLLYKERWCTKLMWLRVCSIISIAILFGGCSSTPSRVITLATTTSTQDTGLLDHLIPLFREKSGIEVKVVAVGTGQALEIGRRGDADVILTHDPVGEAQFVADGFGTSRTEVMSNDFVLIGPVEDRAGAAKATSGSDGFKRVAEIKAVFVSRGDESGTHKKEKATWKAAGIVPSGDWYVQAGQVMGAVMRMADEKNGYALSDRGTYLSHRDRLHIKMLYSGDPTWINQYAVTPTNPNRHPHVKHNLAKQFAEFLLSEEAQQLIANFGRAKVGEPLFRANPRPEGSGPR